MSDFLYIDQNNRTSIEKLSQANLSKGLYNNYQIGNSCWFNGSNNYLTRTFSSGDRKKYTWSGWIKRTTLSGTYRFFCTRGANSDNDCAELMFQSNDTFNVIGWSTIWRTTSALLRDVSAWYHIVVSTDTTRPVASERIRVYINGQEATFSAVVNPSVDTLLGFNQAIVHYIGTADYGAYTPFYLSEINYIDGQGLTPDNFGYFDNQKDFVWKPKKYTGTYGNNGFYLNFSNLNNLGLDFSGNGNHWTLNNMSSLNYSSDSPSNNYPTISPFGISVSSPIYTLSNGNLSYSCSASSGNGGRQVSRATFALPSNGRYYWEVTPTNTNVFIGIIEDGRIPDGTYAGGPKYIAVLSSGTQTGNSTTASYSGAAFSLAVNDIIGFAFDSVNRTLACYKGVSGTWNLIGTFSSIESTSTWFPLFGSNASALATSMDVNFGQRAFSNPNIPTGFRSLCSANLPVPSIKKPNQFFDVLTFTATGSNQSITGLNFSPSFVWIKNRATWAGPRHTLYDIIRGGQQRLDSSTTEAEAADNDLISFDSNGFSSNLSGTTYVSWQWGGVDTSTNWNFDGGINSSLRRNVTISIASPAVVNLTSHGFSPGQAVRFIAGGGGIMPTGISPGVTYYAGNIGINTFNLYDTEANAILAGTTGRINTSGTQSGTISCLHGTRISVNRNSGFSIINYIGTGINASFGHDLGKVPNMIIWKNRDSITDWIVWHSGLVSGINTNLYNLNAGSTSFAQGVFIPGLPWFDSQGGGINVGTSSATNENGKKHIAYCFTQIDGYSMFGTYSGNASADGPFVYCGFRPRWVLVKGAYNWVVHDSERNKFNVCNLKLALNNVQEENGSNVGGTTLNTIDFLSNGFKLRTGNLDTNQSGTNNFIFAAFAETPFKYALAR